MSWALDILYLSTQQKMTTWHEAGDNDRKGNNLPPDLTMLHLRIVQHRPSRFQASLVQESPNGKVLAQKNDPIVSG